MEKPKMESELQHLLGPAWSASFSATLVSLKPPRCPVALFSSPAHKWWSAAVTWSQQMMRHLHPQTEIVHTVRSPPILSAHITSFRILAPALEGSHLMCSPQMRTCQAVKGEVTAPGLCVEEVRDHPDLGSSSLLTILSSFASSQCF